MGETDSFNQFLGRWNTGDPDAATQLFERFTHRLIALARSRLDPLLLQKLDPEDVVQSAWRSFFVRQANGEFTLTNWDSLWGLLAIITLRKCGHCAEHFHAACRDVRRESSAAVSNESDVLWEAFALDPTPSQAAILTETVEQLMSQLNERERQMLTLCLQGHSVPEISLQVGRTERTVRRMLERVRRLLEEGQCSADMPSGD